MYKKKRSGFKRSSRALVSRVGNFHQALPLTMKVKLHARDTNLLAVGLGQYFHEAATTVTRYGPPTSAKQFYELFYPRGTYHTYFPSQGYNGTSDNGFTYPFQDGSFVTTPQIQLTCYPNQMEAFGYLYKYARVERVDIRIKISNLGLTAIDQAQANAAHPPETQPFSSAALTHTFAILPYSQINAWGATAAASWSPNYAKSNSVASQIAEMPGATQMISSVDGNKEVIYFTKSIDLTQRMAGDSVRQRTWMTSKDAQTGTAGTMWNIPTTTNDDPQLVSLGTSALIDEYLQTRGPVTDADNSFGKSRNNMWLRYNEQVDIHYHLTFWEPKTSVIAF